MTGSWEGNERAIGAVVICDTLQNIVTESPKETFTRADILGLIWWAKAAISTCEEAEDVEDTADVLALDRSVKQ